MNYIKEKVLNIATYGLAVPGIYINLENIKGVIIFIATLILLGLQIKYHLLKIKNEKENKK